MGQHLFFLLLAATAIDISTIGLVASFLEQKFILVKFLVRFVVSTLIVTILMLLGMMLGNWGSQFFEPAVSNWFSASLLLVLSIKAGYDGVKLAPSKRSINATFLGGLSVLATFAGINAFIYSLALGFLRLTALPTILWTAPVFFLALLFTSVSGVRQQKIRRVQSEWILSAISLLCSLIIIYNQ